VAACQGLTHTFDSQDLVDVHLTDGPLTRSEGPNIHSAPIVTSHHDPHPDTPALSLPALASLKLSPIQVKQEEIPISLQTLHQSQSLKRVRVKKESRSPSFMVGLHRWTCSPPCQQSLTASTAVTTKRPLAHSLPPKSDRRTATTTASTPRPSSVPLAADNVLSSVPS
ncbi:hypothetical protein POSPLADRAFT_1143815, partial [Postia placenta MAD-698-R-SB12]